MKTINDFVKSFKAGIKLAQWQKANNLLFSFQRYKDVPLFTVSDTSGWDGHGLFASAINNNGKKGIYITKLVDESPHRDFVLAHEHGHIQLGHLSDGKGDTMVMHFLKRALGNKEVLNNEFAADAYAAERVGYDKAIQCLQYMKTLGLYNKELDKRIANLVKVQMGEKK